MIERRDYGLNHTYKIDGSRCPGVTKIIGETMPKAGLIKWAAECTADYSIDHEAELAAMTYSKRRKALLAARFDDRDTAARRGTKVHAIAVDLAHDRPVIVPDALAGHVEAYRDWLDREDIEPIATELGVVNRAVWYCGTTDLIAHYRGAVTLIDLTTSRSGIFAEKALQITAYRWAESYTLKAWDGAEKPFADLGVEATGAVHIRSDGCDFRPTDSGPEAFEYFRHLAWLHAHDEVSDTWIGPPDDPAPEPPPPF